MLILSVSVYLILSALLTLRIFRTISFTRIVVSFFLVAASLNVLVAEKLSFLNALDRPWLFLLTQAVVCIVLGFMLWDPRKWLFKQQLPPLKFEVKKPVGLDWLLVALMSAIIVLTLYIGSLVPINNSDSLHTHLPRIYYWIQHGSMASWDAVTVTQINKPINLSLQGLWLFLLGGSEKLFFLATWFSLLAVVVLIFTIACQLGASYRASLLAALISLGFPILLLQTYSYQADIFVSALGLASTALLLEYLRGKRRILLFLSLLPLAVALGAKNTAFFFLPFYMLIVLIHFIKERVRFRHYLVFGGIFLLLFGIFSSFKFIQNYIERDQLESTMFATHRYVNPTAKVDPVRRTATNTLRYLYQGFSVDGLTGRLKLSAENLRANAFRSLSERLGLDLEAKEYISEGDAEVFEYNGPPILNEDAAWFGPLSVILIPIACLVVLFGRDKIRKRYLLVSFAFLTAVFLMVSVLITGWSPTNGRYLILPTLVIAPLLAVLLPKRRTANIVVTLVLAIAAAYMAFSSLLINDTNPLVTQFTLYRYQSEKLNRSDDAGFFNRAWTYFNDKVIEDLVLTSPDRRDIRNLTYYQNLFFQSTENIPDIEFINDNVSENDTLYLYMRKSVLEYALFGVDRTRELFPVRDLNDVPSGALVLAENELLETPPPGMSLIASNGHYQILRKN